MWYDSFKFEADPYQKLDPFKIELVRLSWNRFDLNVERERLNQFVSDVVKGDRVGLAGWGAIGSGKTWLARILQKEIQEKQPKSIFIYTKVHKIDPSFATIYQIAMESILQQLNAIKAGVFEKTHKEDVAAWQQIFEDKDLATGLASIFMKDSKNNIAERWLSGSRVSSGDLNKLEVINPIDSDYRRYEVLRDIIAGLAKLFPVVLVVDELDNAPVKLANILSDSLRNMLDELPNNFALICLYTAQAAEQWYELGYTEALQRRIDYSIHLSGLQSKAIPEFLGNHHKLYRDKSATVADQLYPFTEQGAITLLSKMPIEKHFPSYFFSNCEAIAKKAQEERVERIDESFIIKNKNRLPYQYTGETSKLDDYR